MFSSIIKSIKESFTTGIVSVGDVEDPDAPFKWARRCGITRDPRAFSRVRLHPLSVGGGQPYDTDADAVRERLERLYEVDRRSRTRRSHENADVQALYEELLGRPLGEVSHRLLHRTYTDRRPDKVAAV